MRPFYTSRVPDGPGQLFSRQLTGRTLAGVGDGLSNTVFISERMTMDGRVRRERTIALANGVPGYDATESFCEASFQNNDFVSNPDYWWSQQIYCFGYDHTRQPNAKTVDCFVANRQQITTSWIAISARSEHSGGVHCGWLDGAVRFVSSNVEPKIWQSIGTPEGGELEHGEWD